MSLITLPESMERDRQNNIKANSVHVDNNFNALLNAVNNKIDKDGTMTITGNIPMSGHKITGLGTPTMSGDATTLGWVNDYACMLAGSQTVTGDKNFSGIVNFSGTTTAVTQPTTDDSTKIATTAFVIAVLDAMYPLGSVYIGTQNTCPLASFFGTWQLVATDRALWGGNGSNGDSTIAAGLPNITGVLSSIATGGTGTGVFTVTANGHHGDTGGQLTYSQVSFSAQTSNTIYGNSATVQPPAYVVNVWRRTA